MPTFKSLVDIQNYIESSCAKAVKDTAKEAEKELKKCIQKQYYNDPYFYPNVYQRTEMFLNSVASKMLSNDSSEVYVDIEGMHYKNGFSSWQVVSWASESKHGSENYQTPTQDFWTTFIEWCNNNLLNILKSNLIKYGLNPK